MSVNRRQRGATRKRGGSLRGVRIAPTGQGLAQRLAGSLRRLRYTLRRSVARLISQPLSSAMTVGVVGIALCLPTALYLALINLEQATANVTGPGELALFLAADTNEDQALALAEQLRQDARIQFVNGVSPEQGLAEIETQSGLADAVAALDENPLPWLLRITPQSHADMQALAADLRDEPGIASVRFDREWLQRLQALLSLATRLTVILAALLGLAVLLVVGNTIRLEIQQCETEIEVTKLMGGNNGFVRRPFLLGGAWVGLLGGLVALALVMLAITLLQGPVASLAGSYDSTLQLQGPSLPLAGIVLVAGAGIGLIGAWIAVGRHLAAIEPS